MLQSRLRNTVAPSLSVVSLPDPECTVMPRVTPPLLRSTHEILGMARSGQFEQLCKSSADLYLDLRLARPSGTRSSDLTHWQDLTRGLGPHGLTRVSFRYFCRRSSIHCAEPNAMDNANLAVPELWVDRPLYNQSSDVNQIDEKSRQNEVLRFLLGKTQMIQTDESNSTKSKGRSPSATPEHPHKRITTMKKNVGRGELGKNPQLEPMSETESDEDTIKAHSLETRPTNEFDGEGPSTLEIRNCSLKILLSQSQRVAQRVQADTSEPEGEDTEKNRETCHIRQRKPLSLTQPNGHSSFPRSPRNEGTQTPHSPSIDSRWSARSDMVLIASVVVILLGYCIAIIYRYCHPISYPIPNVDDLFEPWDVSNVSVRFLSPIDHEETTGALQIEWEIDQFPADALRKHGPEPFEYRLLLDGHQLLFDIGYWSVESSDEVLIKKTMRYRLRPRDISNFGSHILRLDVTFPIPGSDDELRTITDETEFIFSAPLSTKPSLSILSPPEGSAVVGGSVVVEYAAHNIRSLDVILDDKWRFRKTHITDGNLLLRGLGAGRHTIVMKATSDDVLVVVTRNIHVVDPGTQVA